MEIGQVAYMHWAKTKGKALYDLSVSGMPPLKAAETGVGLTGLELTGEHPYGYQPLLEAIAGRYGASAGEVFSSIGTSHGFFSVMAAICERGDAVLVEKPTYEPFLSAARWLGLEVKRLERRFEDGYAVDPGRLGRSLTDRTRLVVLANPHNPSGAAMSRETIRKIAAAAADKGALLLIDEVYLEFVEGEDGRTAHGLADNIITTASLSKVYGLNGLRCGWVIARPDIIGKLKMFMDHATPEHVYIAEQYSAGVFPRLDALRAKTRDMRLKNLETVSRFMESEKRLEWVRPKAGIVCFPRLKGRADAGEFIRVLLDIFGTRVVPGYYFECPAHFRLGFGVPEDVLKPGLEAISKALDLF